MRNRNRYRRAITHTVTRDEIPTEEVTRLINAAADLFDAESALLNLDTELRIVGDIHGNVDCLLQIFGMAGRPPDQTYLFLGDDVDRGDCSCEVLILLYSLKVIFPAHVFLLRANHESMTVSATHGFRDECVQKFSAKTHAKFMGSFDSLPVAAVANGWFCVHGGIAKSAMDRDALNSIKKVDFIEENETVSDLLWSDPSCECDAFAKSPRFRGHLFGEAAAVEFLRNCALRGVIHAHQFCEGGYSWPLGDAVPVLTVFSSANYCGLGNDAAIAALDRDGRETIVAVPAPDRGEHRRRVVRPAWMFDDPVWVLPIPLFDSDALADSLALEINDSD
jgi:protein phosphatase